MSKKENKWLSVMNIILFLSAFKAFNLQSLIMIAFFLVAVVFSLKFYRNSAFVVTKTNAILFVFFLFYCSLFFLHYGYSYSILRTALFSILLYYFGWKIIFNIRDPERIYTITIYSIGIGMALYASISFFGSYTGNILSTMNIADRYVIDFWNDLPIPPTNFNTNFLIIFAICSYSVFRLKQWYKIIPVVLVVSGVGVSFGTATRTNLFMLVLSFVLYFVFAICIEKKQYNIQLKISYGKLGFCVVVVALSMFIFVKWGGALLSLFETLFASLQYRTSNYVAVSDDPRWRSWYQSLVGLFQFPFGNNTEMTMEAHNLILEAGRRTGVIPFLLLLVFIIIQVRNVVRFAKCEDYNAGTRCLGFLTVVIAVVAMMIEPVFIGRPFIFIYMSYIWGMTEGMLSRLKNRNLLKK